MAYYNKNNGSFEQRQNTNRSGRNQKSERSFSSERSGKYSSGNRYKKDSKYEKADKYDKSGYDNQSSRDGGSYYDRNDRRKNSNYRSNIKEETASQAIEKAEERNEDELPNILMGRNPVKEAIKNGRSIDRILVLKQTDGSLREIISLARDANILVQETDRAKLDELCMPFGYGERTGNHQGIVAYVPGAEYVELSDILEEAKAKNESPFIILLDSIEDPHNLGSIIRSAECAGAHGVVITKRRSASLTAAACKASAGAVEYVKVARVSNLAGAIDRLKDEGLWIAGADMSGQKMHEANMSGALGLVIGSEGKGISRLIKEKCDFLVSVPMRGRLDSLNAAVAAAILMFEKQRQSK